MLFSIKAARPIPIPGPEIQTPRGGAQKNFIRKDPAEFCRVFAFLVGGKFPEPSGSNNSGRAHPKLISTHVSTQIAVHILP